MNYSTEENRTLLKERLLNESLRITFTKKDGTERTMLCTLNPKSLFSAEEKTSSRAVSSTSIAVFDLEKNDWRSFRWDSIIKVM